MMTIIMLQSGQPSSHFDCAFRGDAFLNKLRSFFDENPAIQSTRWRSSGRLVISQFSDRLAKS